MAIHIAMLITSVAYNRYVYVSAWEIEFKPHSSEEHNSL